MTEQENTIRECLTNIESLLQTNMSKISELEKELQSSKETVQELFNVISEAKSNPVVLEMMNEPVTQLLTIPETATELRVSHWTVRNLIKDGKIPATKVGNQWRVSVANLNSYITNPVVLEMMNQRDEEEKDCSSPENKKKFKELSIELSKQMKRDGWKPKKKE